MPNAGSATDDCSACRLARGNQRLSARTREHAMDARSHVGRCKKLTSMMCDKYFTPARGQTRTPQSRWQTRTPQSRWQTRTPQWRCQTWTDESFITHLLDTLPPAVLDEQVRLYQGRSCGPVVPHAPRALVVCPHLLKSRQEAAQLFDTELRKAGWAPGTRLPRTSAVKFAKKLVWPKT